MTDTAAPSLDLTTAQRYAQRLIEMFYGGTGGFVVGSVRRLKPRPRDIEILLPWRAPDRDAIVARMESHVDAGVTRGLWDVNAEPKPFRAVKGFRPGFRYCQIEHAGSLPFKVDVFRYEPDNLGALLLIRTGPADFSRRWVTELRAQHLAMDGGFVRSAGATVRCWTERDAFALAGWAWVEPEDRR